MEFFTNMSEQGFKEEEEAPGERITSATCESVTPCNSESNGTLEGVASSR